MIRYYLPSVEGDMEVSEQEWFAVVGDEISASYAYQLVKKALKESEIPKEYREDAKAIMKNRISRYGRWVDLGAFTWRGASEVVFIACLCSGTFGDRTWS